MRCWQAGPCRTGSRRCSIDDGTQRVRDNDGMNDAEYMGLALKEAQAARAAGDPTWVHSRLRLRAVRNQIVSGRPVVCEQYRPRGS